MARRSSRRALTLLAATLGLALAVSSAGAAAGSRHPVIEIEKPSNPDHQPIYDRLKHTPAVGRFQHGLNRLRLPRALPVVVKGCNGEIDAAYDPEKHDIEICYEYLAYLDELRRSVPDRLSGTLSEQDAAIGPAIEVVAHELGHALFDVYRMPILGREEDAADQVAAFTLLRLSPDQARKAIAGVAFMYASEAKEAAPKVKDFADPHSVSAQRFFNLVCIAYGSGRKEFADVVDKGLLPKDRAEECPGEYKQVAHAWDLLVAPHVAPAGGLRRR
jgi:hypothetical protein